MPTGPILYGLYMCTGPEPFPMQSMHRIIWLDKEADAAFLIRTDKNNLIKPVFKNYTKLVEWIDNRNLTLIDKETVIPQLRLTDKALEKRYPPSNRKKKKGQPNAPALSAPVEYRRLWLDFLDDITPHLEDVWRGRKSLLALLGPAATKHGVAVNEGYQVLYRFLANSSSRLSVVPRHFASGAKGAKRAGKGYHLGRKKTGTKITGKANDNFALSRIWLERIRDTYAETIKRGVTAAKAYRIFLNLHCRRSLEVDSGILKVDYLPINKRPSKTQFLTHGPGDDPKEALWRKQLLDKEYEKNYRPLDGHAAPKTFRTGLLSQVDASSNDRYLVSVFNPAQTLGTARCIPVIDDETGYIWGFYVGWRVNQEAARLAILNAASDKVEFCARFNITISPNDWYNHMPAEFRADRGEFNCVAVRDDLGSLNRSIEYVISGRPDLRGRGERTHGLLHDHDANGSTFGKFRKRGEKDPADAADQNIFDYTRELIRQVLYHNNFAVVDHLLTTEMRQAGIPPTRRGILEFCMENGYHHRIAYNHDDMVLALCPEYTAVVTSDGIYPLIKRNGDTGDELILKDMRYLGQFAEEQRWLESARRNGRWRIQIKMNPNDPRQVWYQDPDIGLQTFNLATEDPLFGRLATVHDLTLRLSDDTIALTESRNLAEEERARIELQNGAERKSIAKRKRDHLKNRGTGGSSSSTSGRRRALQNEVSALGQAPVPVVITEAHIKSKATPSRPNEAPPNNIIPFNNKPSSQLEKLIYEWLEKDDL